MWRATEEFGLDRIDFGNDNNVMGIWDGKEFVLTVSAALQLPMQLVLKLSLSY